MYEHASVMSEMILSLPPLIDHVALLSLSDPSLRCVISMYPSDLNVTLDQRHHVEVTVHVPTIVEESPELPLVVVSLSESSQPVIKIPAEHNAIHRKSR